MLRSDFARKLLNNSLAHGLNFGSRWLLNLVVARQLLAGDLVYSVMSTCWQICFSRP